MMFANKSSLFIVFLAIYFFLLSLQTYHFLFLFLVLKKKIGGILIENILKSNGTVVSIIGIGLNVNQINFEDLPKASSLAIVKNKEFDRTQILYDIVNDIKKLFTNWNADKCDFLWENYNNLLFKRGVLMPFEDKMGQQFMGIIIDVTSSGKLRIFLADDSIKEFDIKEVQMLY